LGLSFLWGRMFCSFFFFPCAVTSIPPFFLARANERTSFLFSSASELMLEGVFCRIHPSPLPIESFIYICTFFSFFSSFALPYFLNRDDPLHFSVQFSPLTSTPRRSLLFSFLSLGNSFCIFPLSFQWGDTSGFLSEDHTFTTCIPTCGLLSVPIVISTFEICRIGRMFLFSPPPPKKIHETHFSPHPDTCFFSSSVSTPLFTYLQQSVDKPPFLCFFMFVAGLSPSLTSLCLNSHRVLFPKAERCETFPSAVFCFLV